MQQHHYIVCTLSARLLLSTNLLLPFPLFSAIHLETSAVRKSQSENPSPMNRSPINPLTFLVMLIACSPAILSSSVVSFILVFSFCVLAVIWCLLTKVFLAQFWLFTWDSLGFLGNDVKMAVIHSCITAATQFFLSSCLLNWIKSFIVS